MEWAWAMNAASSVLGSVLAIVIAIQFGFNVTLACGAAAYVLALLLLSAFSAWRIRTAVQHSACQRLQSTRFGCGLACVIAMRRDRRLAQNFFNKRRGHLQHPQGIIVIITRLGDSRHTRLWRMSPYPHEPGPRWGIRHPNPQSRKASLHGPDLPSQCEYNCAAFDHRGGGGRVGVVGAGWRCSARPTPRIRTLPRRSRCPSVISITPRATASIAATAIPRLRTPALPAFLPPRPA